MKIQLVFCCSLIWALKAKKQHCYADIKSPYSFFSSKTSYETTRARFMRTPDECSPTYMWALLRHGTRYNSAKEITLMRNLINLRDQIINNHEQGRGELCPKDLENIRQWKFLLTESLNSGLTSQGRLDHSSIAKRLKKKFPTLLSSQTKDNFVMQSSEIQRAKDSAVAFTNELLGTKFVDVNGNNISENPKLLHLAKICPRYEREVADNRATYNEFFSFLKSDKVKQVLIEISKRLGFENTLSYSDIDVMYESCAYENAWYVNSRPPFCAVFTEENLKIFEYIRDLDSYWETGYGHPMNEKLGCNTVRDMMLTLRYASQKNQQKHKATLYFSHSEMILPTTVKLSLNRDEEPLRHDNYDKMKENRKWKLGSLDCFASNIIAVLFKCSDHKEDENQVVFYQNEHEIVLPGCSGSPCSLKLLEKLFEDVFDEKRCNAEFCQLSPSKSEGYSILRGWIMLMTFLFILFKNFVFEF